jgi:hypothetical protein
MKWKPAEAYARRSQQQGQQAGMQLQQLQQQQVSFNLASQYHLQ